MTAAGRDCDAPSVAIVHDYLNQCGGAERVALELARTWPGATIYTSLYRPDSTFPDFAGHRVRVSPLDRVPVDTGFRALAPLYPLAFRGLGVLGEEVVISSSSGWAHGVRTAPGTLHVVYCHTPARWLYRSQEHLRRSLGPTLLAPLRWPLRRWDQAAARRADLYIANSAQVQARVRAVYGREAKVVYPPVDVDRFVPRERGERLLVISRLLPYKRVDLVVRAASRAGLGLDVVGVGPCLERLRALAGPTVKFHGRVDDATLGALLEGCRALCVAAAEDFGMAAVEAGAAGKPVVAFAGGGALETVTDGVNGILFAELTEQALLDAIVRADALEASPEELAAHARRFSARVFRERMRALVNEALGRSCHGRPRDRPSR
jgi:glycosyltransferase involved in cell wall biosynthesis